MRRAFHTATVLFCLAVAPAPLLAQEAPSDTPTASYQVPIRLGSVDAVSGRLSLRIPLGPKLPGRIPLGFVWSFESTDSLHWRVGGAFRPVVWPVLTTSVPMATTGVLVGGSLETFHKSYAATQNVPTTADIRKWMADRGVDDGAAEAGSAGGGTFTVSAKMPTTDGTRWYVETYWLLSNTAPSAPTRVGARQVIFDGQNAIWTAGSGTTYFTNRWQDKVSVVESGGVAGAPTTIRITNERYASHVLTLTVSPNGTEVPLGQGSFLVYQTAGTLSVTNTLGLPTCALSGILRRKSQASVPVVGGWYQGLVPAGLSFQADGETASTALDWITTGSEEVKSTDPNCSGCTMTVPSPIALLKQIRHPGGLVESFRWDRALNLSSAGFSTSTGIWNGYRIGIPAGSSASDEPPNPSSALGVQQITREAPNTSGQSVLIRRKVPLISKAAGTTSYTWTQPGHETYVLTYPSSTPGGDYRGTRLLHPSATSFSGTTGQQAFLFATSSLVGRSEILGSGAPSGASDQAWLPSGYSTIQTTTYDGWDLSSWANPTGAINVGLPVNPVPTRITKVSDSLPTSIVVAGDPRIAGSRDAFGPVRTDEYLTPTQALPTLDPVAPGRWNTSSPPSPTGNIQRTGLITRAFDMGLGLLLTNTEQKTLGGSDLPALRAVTGSTVNFGTTTNAYDAAGRLKSVTGTRGNFVAVESRIYEDGLPLLRDTTKKLTYFGIPVYPNPAQPNVVAGSEFQYDSTPFKWLRQMRDKSDGRWVVYGRDDLGRQRSVTDVEGIVTTTDYDGWGRVRSVTRAATGQVGSLTTTYAYDPNGLWKTESVSAEGRTLTTRWDYDALGRLRSQTFPDGSVQTTDYDGWNQRISQSPVLKPGQASFGSTSWSYDERGRVTSNRDPQGRTLSTVIQQPTWTTLNAGGTALTGIVTTIADDRGYIRSSVTDLLGQKLGVVDQKGQLSTFQYDKDGHLSRTQQGNQTRSYTFNDMGWLTSRTEPEEGTTTYSNFTLSGLPLNTTVSGRSGGMGMPTTTTLTLNAWLAPMTSQTTGVGGAVSRTLGYDAATRRPMSLTESQPNGTVTEAYGYDDLGRLNFKSISDGTQTFSMSRTLDAFGNVTRLMLPGGGGATAQVVTTLYDALNRPYEVRLDGVTRGHLDYDQVVGSSVSQTLTYGNGTTTVSKEDQGELVRVTHSAPSGVLEDNALVWTAGGLLRQRGTDLFEYDELRRLKTSAVAGLNPGETVTQNFSYDRYGNRTGSAFAYTGPGKPDELLSWTATYTSGNDLPSQVQTVTGPLSTQVAYDSLGRMIQVKAIPSLDSSLTRWTYDATGRVVEETVNGRTTKFLLDGEGLRFKRLAPDGSVVYTVYGFNREPLAQFELGVAAPAAPAIQPLDLRSQDAEASPNRRPKAGKAVRR